MLRLARLLALLIVASISLHASSSAASAGQLGSNEAKRALHEALAKNGELGFDIGQDRKVNCDQPLSSARIRCAVSWYLGDTGYAGSALVWTSNQTGFPLIRYSYKIRRTDYYCLNVLPEGSDCVDVIQVR